MQKNTDFNDRKQLARFIFLMFLTGLLLYICWLMLAPFISILLWSAILVFIFHPLYKRLMNKTGNHTVSAISTILVSLFIFIIPLLIISASAISELSGFSGISADEIKMILTDFKNSRLSFVYDYLNRFINTDNFLKPEDIKSVISKLSDIIFSASMYFIEGAFGVIVGLVISVFVMFYLFRDGDKILRDIPGILPMDKSQAELLFIETSDLINATIRGTLFVALMQGVLAGLIFWILGIPGFILLGLLAMIFSMIPSGGTAFVTVPVIIVLAVSGDYWKAGILAAYAALVIGMVDNFLLPKLIKQKVKMNELFIFFSVLGGLQLFGLLGLFLGPIVLALALGVFKVFRGEKIDKETVSMK
ncbi:MAG TPA: AI-2E family transporter [Ignavibacteria bacterium]|nr:AI-2E family transporter [Ignavibacteria bacterium]HMR41122.1 AI-2E family transporter [Ignavibacteria bacterium]